MFQNIWHYIVLAANRVTANLFVVFVIALLSVVSMPSRAEPTHATQWLMNEPMSLFDWGIYQADKKLKSLKETSSLFTIFYMGGTAQYDWNADRIRLHVMFQGKGTDAECVDNIKKAKGAFLNFTWNESEHPKIARDVLAGLFNHEGGYTSGSRPKDMGEQLANITTLEATVYVSGGNTLIPKVRCQMTFNAREVSIIQP